MRIVQKCLCLVLFLFLGQQVVYGRVPESSSPYVSGDTFRSMCDYHFDEVTTSFLPTQVQAGDVIFVKTDMLGDFFRIKHPLITNPYILVSHNSDGPAPGLWGRFLEDPKIVVWFAQNVQLVHPKLRPIPIGLANKMWPHGKPSILTPCRKKIGSVPRNKPLYMNFSVGTYRSERQKAFGQFINKKYCFYSPVKSWDLYLHDLLSVRFVLSPRGNGLDCHRTWEALYMGAIPIVKESPMDAVFEALPVVIVKNWEEITEEFLQKKYCDMSQQAYKDEKLFDLYWKRIFQSYREIAQEQAQKNHL